MSAFIVSHDHIDALMTFAIAHRVSYYVASAPGVTITSVNASEVGAILLDENERSVNHRYPNSRGDLPGTIGEDAASYRYRPFSPFIHMQPGKLAVTVIKGCSCFDYQACETDDYEDSLAHMIIEAIRADALRALPAYEDAPWEINRPALVRKAV